MTSTAGKYDFSNWTMPDDMSKTACQVKPTVFSNGFAILSGSYKEILTHPTTLLTLQLVAVFSLQAFLYYPLRLLKLPPLIIQVAAGAIIGFLVDENAKHRLLLHDEALDVFNGLITIAHILFIFSVAVKTDMTTIPKSGNNAWMIGLSSVFVSVPATMGGCHMIVRGFWSKVFGNNGPENITYFAFLDSVTQFVVVVSLLIDLSILNSEIGRLCSAASLINYFTSKSIQWIFNFLRVYRVFPAIPATIHVVIFVTFIVGVLVIGKAVSKWIIRSTPEGKPLHQSQVFLILSLVALVACLSDKLGLEYRVGPFWFGLVLPTGHPIASSISKRLDAFIHGMLMPILMAYAGYHMNLGNWELKSGNVWAVLLVVFLNVATKLAVIVLPARYYKMPYRDSLVVCLIMCSKGSMEVILYAMYISRDKMEESEYTLEMTTFLVTSVLVPILVSRLYDPGRKYKSYQPRNIMSTLRDAEVRIVTCIHRHDDAMAVVNLLEVSEVTKASPTTIYVLHLVELVGRSIPLLIDHQCHDMMAERSSGPQLKHIIDVFNYYKSGYLGFPLEVRMHTSVSPHRFMHDDICELAFDKVAPLIILPFHRKWNAKGLPILDDRTLRAINLRVFHQAPCSVGVLIDRSKVCLFPHSPSAWTMNRVAVLFIGGEDDREALALGRHMARSPQVQLTIVQVLPKEEEEEDKWEKVLNAELIKAIMIECSENGNVSFKQEVVTNSSQTAAIVRLLEGDFDLVLVGCHHRNSIVTAGLDEWTEFPELGSVGDILASSDIKCPVSVLVVQQHKFEFNVIS